MTARPNAGYRLVGGANHQAPLTQTPPINKVEQAPLFVALRAAATGTDFTRNYDHNDQLMHARCASRRLISGASVTLGVRFSQRTLMAGGGAGRLSGTCHYGMPAILLPSSAGD